MIFENLDGTLEICRQRPQLLRLLALLRKALVARGSRRLFRLVTQRRRRFGPAYAAGAVCARGC